MLTKLVGLGDEPLFFWGGYEKFTGTNNFFFSYKHTNNFFAGNGFANNLIFLRNAMLYYEEFYVTILVNITTYWIISVVLFLCYFNLSSTCLLASLITSSLKSYPVNCSIKDSSAPTTLSIVLFTVDWCNFDTSVLTGNALSWEFRFSTAFQ